VLIELFSLGRTTEALRAIGSKSAISLILLRNLRKLVYIYAKYKFKVRSADMSVRNVHLIQVIYAVITSIRQFNIYIGLVQPSVYVHCIDLMCISVL